MTQTAADQPSRKWFKDKYGVMANPSKSAYVAVDIIEALMCRLSERDIEKMDLVEDVLNHCLFSFAEIIEHHTKDLEECIVRLREIGKRDRAEIAELKQLLSRCVEYVERDVQMVGDITCHSPLPPEDQTIHDTTVYSSERLLEQLKQQLAEATEKNNE